MTAIRKIRLFLLLEGATFVVAALIHAGVFVEGYRHREAMVAESIIAAVLLTGWLLTWIRRPWTRRIGLAVQAFALLGTLVGIFTMAIGVGPRTIPDVVYHVAIVAVLVWGLAIARQKEGT